MKIQLRNYRLSFTGNSFQAEIWVGEELFGAVQHISYEDELRYVWVSAEKENEFARAVRRYPCQRHNGLVRKLFRDELVCALAIRTAVVLEAREHPERTYFRKKGADFSDFSYIEMEYDQDVKEALKKVAVEEIMNEHL